jgi:hypothetical protein
MVGGGMSIGGLCLSVTCICRWPVKASRLGGSWRHDQRSAMQGTGEGKLSEWRGDIMVGGGMSIGGLCLSVDCESISLRWIVKACRSVDCEGMISQGSAIQASVEARGNFPSSGEMPCSMEKGACGGMSVGEP